MRTLLALLCFTSSLLAADGYQHEAQSPAILATQVAAKMKAGEIVKLRRFASEFDPLAQSDGNWTYTAVLFDYTRGINPKGEVKLTVNEEQKRFIQTAQMLFLRKADAGWQYLGTNISRDAKGAVVFQY